MFSRNPAAEQRAAKLGAFEGCQVVVGIDKQRFGNKLLLNAKTQACITKRRETVWQKQNRVVVGMMMVCVLLLKDI